MAQIFKSIVPSDMTPQEIVSMRFLLEQARDKGQDHAIVNLPYGEYKNPISRLDDYVNPFIDKRVYVIELEQPFVNYYATCKAINGHYAKVLDDNDTERVVSIGQLEICEQ